MDAAQRFEAVAKLRGDSPFYPASLPEIHQQKFDLYAAILRNALLQRSCRPPDDSVHVGFIRNPKLNAWAKSTAQSHLVGIHASLIPIIDRTWNWMLGRTTAFPSVGEQSGTHTDDDEAVSTVTLGGELVSLPDGELASIIVETSEGSIPRDPARARFAQEMAALSVNFAMYHEAGHLVAGHALRASQLGLMDGVVEVVDRQHEEDNVPQATRHAWELFADKYAFVHLCELAISQCPFGEDSPLLTEWWLSEREGRHFPRECAIFAAVGAAMTCLFLLFVSADKRETPTHPHPFLRLMWQQTQQHFLPKTAIEDAGSILQQASLQVWTAWSQLGLPTLRTPPHEKVVQELTILTKNVHRTNIQLQFLNWDRVYA